MEEYTIMKKNGCPQLNRMENNKTTKVLFSQSAHEKDILTQ
jgi:hypothetical protein